jgi:hypothetical protein
VRPPLLPQAKRSKRFDGCFGSKADVALGALIICRMSSEFSGKCACGSIRYKCATAPIAMLNCHCVDCQSSSGAPFASGVVVMSSDLEIYGTPKTYAVRASSGKTTARSFCAECGTPLFTCSEANSQFTSIRFPTLDDSSAFAPMLDIWTSSAQPWVCPDEKLPHFAQSPQQPE